MRRGVRDQVVLAVLAEHEPLRLAQPPHAHAQQRAPEQRRDSARRAAAIAMMPCVSVIDADHRHKLAAGRLGYSPKIAR